MTLFTIGFTRQTAEQFFAALRTAGVARLLDVRLGTSSQLAGFAKMPDLAYFLRAIAGIDYQYLAQFAPSGELLDRYRARAIDWPAYAAAYRELLAARRPECELDAALLDNGCLLCSEHSADRCHRRIAAEYLRDAYAGRTGIAIVHL